ncbi:C-terminal binding protein [Bauldia sp.]|uniref:C-terminal binding protein n=1 Tax=Bauldia sp. TaxID=2575872 RepID=UPI003BA8AE18
MTESIRLLTPDAQYPDDGLIERDLMGPDTVFDIFREREPERLPDDLLARADGIVVWHEMPIDAAFVARIPACRIIARAGVGFDHIDLQATGAAGIPVCNTPDYGTSEVADHAIALTLALRRALPVYHQELSNDPIGAFVTGFDTVHTPLVRRLRGSVFGIVGLGRIGTATALRAKAFGLDVVAYDPYVSAGTEIAVGVRRVDDLGALLAESDVVSLHCPLTDETRGMIGATELAQMKSDALLINTARGGVVDVPALLAAIETGQIGGAGLDVLPSEPPQPDDAIVAAYKNLSKSPLAGRLLLTPHSAWSSPESAADARRLAMETTLLYLREGRLRNLVNEAFLVDPR